MILRRDVGVGPTDLTVSVSVNRRIFNICKDAFDFAFDEINDLHKYE
jgi:hypothetical protein